MMGNMDNLLNMAKQLQEQLKLMTVKVSAGQNAVELIINGNQEVVQLSFKPEMLEHPAELAALTADVFNEGMRESKRMMREELSKMTGGMNIPFVPGLF
ncbi:MAG: YbaB/EbfC family nucleoid-associated protein [Firmicutes bacterium]|nr:YbaB/EbfC family nucleoid-associated protein [Bacillota bacterium]